MSKRIPRYQRESEPRPDLPPPAGRIAADLSQQAPHNSYAGVPLYYEDTPFTCVDCGKEEVLRFRPHPACLDGEADYWLIEKMR